MSQLGKALITVLEDAKQKGLITLKTSLTIAKLSKKFPCPSSQKLDRPDPINQKTVKTKK